MNKIIGVGNALVDILVLLNDDSALKRFSLPKGGMQLIDDKQHSLISRELSRQNTVRATGGSAGNAILALSKLGNEVGFIGRIGNDEMGDFFRDNCKQVGIDARLITADALSGVANTFISPDGERTFATHLGAAAGMTAQDITPTLFQGYQILHIEGYLVQNHDLMEAICQTAKAEGLKLSIDLASYNVVKDDLSFMRHLVKDYIDIVFANEEESAAFTEGKIPEDALSEIASMCEIAVVKLGSKGACAMMNGTKASTPALKVNVKDTTAAGDFFAGGFLHALVHGKSLRVCLETGALLSANVIQVVGTHLSDEQWTIINNSINSNTL